MEVKIESHLKPPPSRCISNETAIWKGFTTPGLEGFTLTMVGMILPNPTARQRTRESWSNRWKKGKFRICKFLKMNQNEATHRIHDPCMIYIYIYLPCLIFMVVNVGSSRWISVQGCFNTPTWKTPRKDLYQQAKDSGFIVGKGGLLNGLSCVGVWCNFLGLWSKWFIKRKMARCLVV